MILWVEAYLIRFLLGLQLLMMILDMVDEFFGACFYEFLIEGGDQYSANEIFIGYGHVLFVEQILEHVRDVFAWIWDVG